MVFDTFSIPAIDLLIGEVTIDLTPRAILQGHITGNITVNDPGNLNKQELQWTTQGGRNIVFVTFNEDKDIEVNLFSSTLSLTKLTIIMDVGASLRTLIGSKSYDLGSLPLPISIAISTKGSPDSVTLAKFSGSTPSSFEPLEDLSPTELWIYVIIAIAVIAATITAGLVWRRRHRATKVSQETEKSADAGGSV